MKVIMTGGGTGGHIYPAITIADKIKRKHPDAEILFVGTKRGMEKDIVPQHGYPIEFIEVSGFNRKNLLKSVKTIRDLLAGIRQSREIIRRFKPDIVIGTGGYVCGPVVRAAHKLGIRTYIHEQNALPGLTNRMLEKHADKIFISFEESRKHFRHPEKTILSGNPIRVDFLRCSFSGNREKAGIGPSDFVVLCFGGSLGSETINSAVAGTIGRLAAEDGVWLNFVTGKSHYEKISRQVGELGLPSENRIRIMEYVHDMPEYLACADVVVCRAGALTVSEIAACGKASILIPSPYVANNHQYYNAKVLADAGAAILIEEKDLTADKLFDTIMRLKNNKEMLNRMGRESEKLGRMDATEIIFENLDI